MTKNLLFDLGGVIMDIDPDCAVKAFENLGMKDADKFFDPYTQHGAFLSLEQGTISPDEFRAEVRRCFDHPVSDEILDTALFEFLRGIPESRLDRLKSLREAGHKIYMLSNTNPIMWHGYILPQFRKQGGDIHDYFDGIVTSFEAGVCKPDPRIFQYAIEKLGIDPAATTFYDDGPANVEAAKNAGFKAVLCKGF